MPASDPASQPPAPADAARRTPPRDAPVRRTQPAAPSSGAVMLGQAAAILAGGAMSVQSRLNGEFGARTGDPITASLTGFSIGLGILVIGTVLIPAGRRGLIRAVQGLRGGQLRPWFLLAGVFGAFLVIVQTSTVPLVGVSVFLLGMVVGQAIGGLGVDHLGLGPGGTAPLTRRRLLGTLVIVAAVGLAQLPHLLTGQGTGGGALGAAAMLLPVLAGIGTAGQTAFNGRIGAHAGTPIAPTLLNFLSGVIALALASAVHRATGDLPPWHFPPHWWLYLGGPLGILFVAAGAVLSRVLGVLRTGLSMTAGMLTGALLLDLLVPTPGALVTPLTVLGTLLAFAGLLIVSTAGRRARRTTTAEAARGSERS